MNIDAFAPLQMLAGELLPHALEPSEDGAHDLSHLQRVWHNVRTLHSEEGGDLDVLLAAVLLHDCVAVEKNSPLRSQASRLAAEKASALLAKMDWPNTTISAVAHAIEAHSFSADIAPLTLEAKVMQDADRLDSLECLVLRAPFTPQAAWAARYMTRKIRKREHGTTMTSAIASITSRQSCCTWRTVSRRHPANAWRASGMNV